MLRSLPSSRPYPRVFNLSARGPRPERELVPSPTISIARDSIACDMAATPKLPVGKHAHTQRLWDQLLNGEIFYALREAQIVIESWRRHLICSSKISGTVLEEVNVRS
jgi:hypothetical protein